MWMSKIWAAGVVKGNGGVEYSQGLQTYGVWTRPCSAVVLVCEVHCINPLYFTRLCFVFFVVVFAADCCVVYVFAGTNTPSVILAGWWSGHDLFGRDAVPRPHHHQCAPLLEYEFRRARRASAALFRVPSRLWCCTRCKGISRIIRS